MPGRGRIVAVCVVLLAGAPLPAIAQGTPAARIEAAPATPFDRTIAAARAALASEPTEALAQARTAQALAERLPAGRPADLAAATAQWLAGEALVRLDRPVEALPPLQHALATAERLDRAGPLRGDILLSQGAAEVGAGQVQRGLTDFEQARDIFRDLGEPRGQAKALERIGGIYQNAGDSERSLRYYAEVIELDADDPAITLVAHENMGETLRALGRFNEARKHYRLALAAAERLGSPLRIVPVLTNLASVELMGGNPVAAEATARRALALTSQGEAAGERRFVWGVLARIAFRAHRIEAAGDLIGRTFQGIDPARTTLAYRDFHEIAASIYARLGRNDLAYAHLAAFERLDQGVRKLAASTNAALMAARFDFASQDVRINRLKALQLRSDALFVQSRARLALGAGAILLMMLCVNFLSLSRSRDKVRAANARLSESNASLEKALKVKTEFLATTSHEIRTPLNGILGMTQVMMADGRVEPWLRERIEVVQVAGQTMRALVDDILDIAKIETGNLTVGKAPLDLLELLRSTALFWTGQADAKGLELRLDLAGCPGRIEGDEARLRQIVFNLMSNALKFTHAGHVSLAVGTGGAGADERVVIRVGDSGIGVPADQQALIFEKFHQVDGGTTRQFGGTGLGLAICRSLAEAMGGTIGVVSTPGVGTVFSVDLPLARIEAAPARRCEDAPIAGSLAEATVLLVEANPLAQRIIGKGLRPVVGMFEAVADAPAALARMAERHIDQIVIQADAVVPATGDRLAPLADLIRAAGAMGIRATILFTPDGGLNALTLADTGARQAFAKPVSMKVLIAALAALQGGAGDAGGPPGGGRIPLPQVEMA